MPAAWSTATTSALAVCVAALVLVLPVVDNRLQALAAALVLTTLGLGSDELKVRYSLNRVTLPPQGEVVVTPRRHRWGVDDDLAFVALIVMLAVIDLDYAVLWFGIPIGNAVGRVWEAHRITRFEQEKSWRLFRPKYATKFWRTEYFALPDT
jgi:hypothetical protein